MPISTIAYGASKAAAPISEMMIERRDLKSDDVHLKIKYCGICHSDLHQARDEWTGGIFPMVPGHEIVGIVEAVGSGVTKFKKGDIGGVGCFVDSCLSCQSCQDHEEQHCLKNVLTYGSRDHEGKPTYGGYSKDIVVKDHFVCKVPDSLKENLAAVAPLLCAGITTWTPMVRHGMNKPGAKIGVIGLGGLGHMAVKFGVAFGNEVTVISTSEKKRDEATKILGAKHFVASIDAVQMTNAKGTLDFLIDTVCVPKDMGQYFQLLRPNGKLVTVAIPPAGFRMDISPMLLIRQSKGIFGSLVGGLKATQEMLDFCGEKGITSLIELIKPTEIDTSFERMVKSDVRYRFVIDLEN